MTPLLWTLSLRAERSGAPMRALSANVRECSFFVLIFAPADPGRGPSAKPERSIPASPTVSVGAPRGTASELASPGGERPPSMRPRGREPERQGDRAGSSGPETPLPLARCGSPPHPTAHLGRGVEERRSPFALLGAAKAAARGLPSATTCRKDESRRIRRNEPVELEKRKAKKTENSTENPLRKSAR